MTECSKIDIREALPDFMHGALDADARDRVEVHLDACVSCTAELMLLQQVRQLVVTPAVNAARIGSAIAPYRRHRRWLDGVSLRVAAAFLIAAVGFSAVAVTHRPQVHAHVSTGVQSSIAPASTGVALVSVMDLSDEHLQQLIGEMDQLEAVPLEDPEPVVSGGEEGGL